MKVLVIGSGGREHTLVWKISQSPKVDKIYCAPGNAGIAELAECIDIIPDDINGLAGFALSHQIDLTVVGPELPLVEGIVDLFESRDLRIFGPSRQAALLEGSKVFSKEIMLKYGVPTPRAEIFSSFKKAKDYVQAKGAPLVVKADGLAGGKGVMVCHTIDEALKAIEAIMQKKIFGESGKRILVEDCLFGEEASFIVLTDGENIVPMASSQDHKRIYDGDKGPNTGGMGAYSPAPMITRDLSEKIMQEIIRPVINGLASEGRRYKGVLYAGLMITDQGPKVIEFNVRCGDPESQAVIPRLKNDLIDIINDIIDGRLSARSLDWDERPCVCIVCASDGYPGSYQKGKLISGLQEVTGAKDIILFHAGTKLSGQEIITDGGRVLGVTALGKDIKETIDKAYQAIEKIDFEGIYYRKDIGYQALERGAVKR